MCGRQVLYQAMIALTSARICRWFSGTRMRRRPSSLKVRMNRSMIAMLPYWPTAPKRGLILRRLHHRLKRLHQNCELSPRIIRSLRCHKDLWQVAIVGFVCYQGRMNTIIYLFLNPWNAMGCIGELLGYLLRFVSVFFQTRASVAARWWPQRASWAYASGGRSRRALPGSGSPPAFGCCGSSCPSSGRPGRLPPS